MQLWKPVLEFVVPAKCAGCGANGSYLCDACIAGAARVPERRCLICSQPGLSPCGACRTQQPAFERAVAPFLYDGAVRAAVHQFKYHKVRELAPELARLMAEAAAQQGLSAEVLLPVPMHPRSLRARGYNQAALLAKHISRINSWAVDDESLARVRWSPQQARASTRDERKANVEEAFQVRRPERVYGKRVALVDDVLTTGSTLDAVARVLQEAGAAHIYALTVAREA